jgi:hypothetical protein
VVCVLASLLGILGHSGCHQRAYTELYVESMARDKRELEDLVYEFDAEYRALENELSDLRRVNAQLEARLQESEKVRQEARMQPRTVAPEPARTEPARIESNNTPAQNKNPAPRKTPKVNSEELELPEVIIPKTPPPILPGGAPADSGDSSILPAPDAPTSGGVKPPRLMEPLRAHAPSGLPSDLSDPSLGKLRISAPSFSPVQLASATSVPPQEKKPTDLRARQMEFHPSLCRGNNTDGKPGDDGMYLVLVPRNTQQEFVPAIGNLTIVMEETISDDVPRRIGRWEFTANELQEMLEPIGNGQGYHLPLAWQDQIPESNAVDVYIRFTDTDGTTMVNHKQIHLRKSTPGQSTWTPR